MSNMIRQIPWHFVLAFTIGSQWLSAQSNLTIRRAVMVESVLRADRSYQLEGSEGGTNWTPVGQAVSGFSGVYSWFHPADTEIYQLFRIVEGEASLSERDVPGVGLRMVEIPAGRFLMGSPDGELGRVDDEGPQREVEITESFWMGKFEVTQAEWNALMPDNPSDLRGDLLPVENVTWADALGFCQLLTDRERDAGRLEEGFVIRLPTEAEWEYACRANTGTRFYWGDDTALARIDEFAWVSENSNGEPKRVGQLSPNGFGLHDILGNVGEWILDYYGSYAGAPTTNPVGPESGGMRVFRGGAWLFSGGDTRSAIRGALDPTNANGAIGFRIVCAKDMGDSNIPQDTGASSSTWTVDLDPNLVTPGDTIEMVRIASGKFPMGAPARLVEITRPYWIGVFEVTQEQWTYLMGENRRSFPSGPRFPVNSVTWNEAATYCRQATELLNNHGALPNGYEVGLPTEAQWEKAVRGGTETPYFFGTSDVQLGEYAWFLKNSRRIAWPVGSKLPSPNGLYDVYGNVKGWCLDFFVNPPDPADLVDPFGPNRVTFAGDQFVVKGGDYESSSGQLQSAVRGGETGFEDLRTVGFRVAIRPIIP